MKTIKFILNDDGSILDSSIGFQINQYSYNDTLINVYVPSNIVSETETYNEVIDEHVTKYYTTGTNIAMCMSYASRNGSRNWSKTYYFTYVKNNVVINNKTYTLFERKMPREFTLYAGNQLYAINVIQYQTILTRDTTNIPATETTETTTLGIVSTATYTLNINASINMAENPQETTTDLSTLIADVNALMIAIVGKQDKQDASILVNIANGNPQTTDYVVNALNYLNQRVKENFNTNESQANYISDLNDRVSDLERGITTEFRYIGTYVSNDDPNASDLTDYVEGLGYTLQNGDVVIWIKELTTTDKNYRCLYNEVGGWSWYEIPPIERANNDGYGSIKGTYWDNDMSYLKVDIDEGLIQDIYIKRSGNWVSLYDEINNLLDFKSDLISGSQAVGKAIYALYDDSEENKLIRTKINDKFMTNLNGASKQFVQNYALPRQFNDVNSLHFTATGDVFGPSTYVETASSKATALSLGDNTILDAKLWVSFNATSFSYQLSNKNSFKAVFNIAFASSIADVGFTLNITYVTEDNIQTLVASVPTDRFNYDANTHKLTISDYFNRLNEVGITVSAGHYDIELICNTTSSGNTITIYSGANANVYSTLSFSTDAYTLVTSQSGIIVHEKTLTLDTTNNNVLTADLGNIALADKTQHQFILQLPVGVSWTDIPDNCYFEIVVGGVSVGYSINKKFYSDAWISTLSPFLNNNDYFNFIATCLDDGNGNMYFDIVSEDDISLYTTRNDDIQYDSVEDKYYVSTEYVDALLNKICIVDFNSVGITNDYPKSTLLRVKEYDDTNKIYSFDYAKYDDDTQALINYNIKLIHDNDNNKWYLACGKNGVYTQETINSLLNSKADLTNSYQVITADKVKVNEVRDLNNNVLFDKASKVKLDNAYGPAYVGEDTSVNILAKSSNTGIWKATDNGHWYYWDGTQYVDGGVYNFNSQDVIKNSSSINLLNEATYDNKVDITNNVTTTSGKMYDWATNEINGVSNGLLLKVDIIKGYKYYVTTSLTAQADEYPLISYFDSSNNKISYEYMNVASTLTSISDQELYIPNNASYFYVNARNTTPYVYERTPLPLENNKIINTITSLQEIEPNLIWQGRLYYWNDKALSYISNGVVFKYNVNHNIQYYVTTSITAQSTGFPLVIYFDSSDNYISYEYMNTAGSTTSITDQLLNIPLNASYFYVNARATLPVVKTIQVNTSKKEIKILFVGNSLTQDGIAYLPYMLKTYYPDVNFKIYMWYNGGYTLAQHYQKFINNQACEIFSIANNTSNWANGTITMSSLLSLYKFDIVCLQEYFNYKETYTESDLVDFNNCVSYITSNYTGGNPLKYITLFHAPKRDNATNIYNLTKSGIELILQKTICEDMIGNGIAVYKALSTDLDNLGDQGHLSPDGTHTQEGLPCLLQTYVTLLWILNKYGINTSIYGFDFKMTTAIYNTLNVPGSNLGTGVIEGTDSQNLLAQEVAIKSFKKSVYIVNNNLDN